VTQPTKGTLTLHEDGTFEFIADPGAIGEDSFTFSVHDSEVAQISVAAVTEGIVHLQIEAQTSTATPNPTESASTPTPTPTEPAATPTLAPTDTVPATPPVTPTGTVPATPITELPNTGGANSDSESGPLRSLLMGLGLALLLSALSLVIRSTRRGTR
jgi:hypothetical protein